MKFSGIIGLKTSPNKLLVNNLFFNVLNNLISIIVPIFIQYRIARVLNFENIGEINVILAAQTWFLLFFSSTQWYLVSKIPRFKNVSRMKFLLSNNLFFGICINFLSTFIYFLYFIIIKKIQFSLVFFGGVGLLFGVIGSDFFYQATLNNKSIFFRKIIFKLVFLITVFCFINSHDDYLKYFVFIIIFNLLEALISFWGVKNFIDFRLVKFRAMKKMLFFSFKLLLFNISYGVLPTLLILILPHYLQGELIGIQTTLIKLFTLITSLITSLALVFMPYIASIDKSLKINYLFKSFKWVSIFAVVICIILMFLKSLIEFLFLNGSNIAISSYISLLLYVIFHSQFNHLIFNYFVEKKLYLNLIVINLILIILFLGQFVFLNSYFPLMFNLVMPSLVGLITAYIIIFNKFRFENSSK